MTPRPVADRAPFEWGSALQEYRRRTGRALSEADCDLAQPGMRALYDGFRARFGRAATGAADAQWLALRRGIKPMVRELLRAQDVRAQLSAWHDAGYIAVHHKERVSLGSWDGMTGTHAGAGRRYWVVYVGRPADEAQMRKASELDADLLADTESTGLAERVREHGRLLGYPTCCVDAYASLGHVHDNYQPIAASAARTARFDWRTNVLSAGALTFLCWFPCRFDCPASLQYAAALAPHLPAESLAAAERWLKPARLYVNERMQLLFEDSVRTGERTIEVGQRVRSAFSVDGRREHAAAEWVFYADVVRRLRPGDAIRVVGSELEVRRGGQIERLTWSRAPLLLPFTA